MAKATEDFVNLEQTCWNWDGTGRRLHDWKTCYKKATLKEDGMQAMRPLLGGYINLTLATLTPTTSSSKTTTNEKRPKQADYYYYKISRYYRPGVKSHHKWEHQNPRVIVRVHSTLPHTGTLGSEAAHNSESSLAQNLAYPCVRIHASLRIACYSMLRTVSWIECVRM